MTDPEIQLPSVTFECNEDFPSELTATWTDNCSDGGEVSTGPTNIIRKDCLENADYVFTVVDDCGNTTTETLKVVREIEVIDECETAFARHKSLNDCFIPDFDRWGWTNYIEFEGNYEMYLYAGAAKCDISKGAEVGTVVLNYIDGIVTVTYDLYDNYVMNEAHLYIGCEQYPTGSNGDLTVAPGQYNFKPNVSEGVSQLVIGPIEVDGPFYMIAHAVTCELLCVCSDTNNGTSELYEPENYDPIDCIDEEPLAPGFGYTVDFTAYPVPYKDIVNISYEFGFDTDVTIEIFDRYGFIVDEARVSYSKNSEGLVTFDLSRIKDQMLFVKLSTKNGNVIKQIISNNKKR